MTNVTNVISPSILGKYITIFEILCRWVSLAVGAFHFGLHTWKIWTQQCASYGQTIAFILFKKRSVWKDNSITYAFQLHFKSLAEKKYIHYFKLDKNVMFNLHN